MSTKYASFACPNPACGCYNRFGDGNIGHRSWMGKDNQIERLVCRICRQSFSSRKGTLLEHAKVPEDRLEALLRCFRWGVHDKAIADIVQVDVKTVRLFREKVAHRAEIHHDSNVKNVDAQTVECDELYGKHCQGKTWMGAAIALPSFLILAVCIGARNQEMADRLLSQIRVRCASLGMILTDGWRPYWSALVRCFGRLFQPRRSGGRGCKKMVRIKLSQAPFYGQIVKKVNKTFALIAIECRAWIGSLQECTTYIRAYELGNVIHTTHIERWWGTLRMNVAALRRKSRCPARTPATLRSRAWVFVSLYNWVIPHTTLSDRKKMKVTPAMAAGLAQTPLSYKDYLRLVVLPAAEVKALAEQKLSEMGGQEWKRAFKRTQWKPPDRRVLWRASTGEAA